MTNQEKFEMVFGVKVDIYPVNACHIFGDAYCDDHICNESCPAFKFWEKKYEEKEEKDEKFGKEKE